MSDRDGRSRTVNGPLPISVVIPVYNRADMIAAAVTSALAQVPRPPAEVIVADDGSTDDSARLAEQAGATVVRLENNRGETAARNAAVERATQPWIACLDSDDEWLPHHLERIWARAEDHVLVSAATWIPVKGDGVFGGSPTEFRLTSPADIVTPENPIVTSGTLVRRDVLLRAGGFPEGMRLCGDLDAWIRVLEHGEGLALPSVGVKYGVHDGQVSHDPGPMRQAHRDVVLSYRDRPWLTRRVLNELDAIFAWDDARAALRSRDPHRIARTLRALAGPRRIAAVHGMRRLRRAQLEAAEAVRRTGLN